MDATATHDATHRPCLLAEQLRVLEDRRADVADLLESGGPHDETFLDSVANDLVGAHLTFVAALAAPPPRGVSGAEREELVERGREAVELLRAALDVLAARRR